MMEKGSQKLTVMERKLTPVSTFKMLSALRIWRVLLIDSTISKKTSMDHMLENHLVQVIKEFTIGQRRLRMVICNLVFLVKVSIAPKKWFSHKVYIWVILKSKQPFTVKLTATSPLVSKNLEIITGSLIQQSTDLDMVKREFSMEQQRLWNQRDMTMISPKPWLLKRQSKITKVFHPTYWAFQRT